MKLKAAAIQEPECPHHLDHLVPLCDLLKAPLYVTDDFNFNLASKYYPKNLEVLQVEPYSLTSDYLTKKYDLVIHTVFWPKETFHTLFKEPQKRYNKKVRSLFSPHGNSDKGHHSYWMERFALEDILLVYGDHMVDFLKQKKVLQTHSSYVRMGNLRYDYFLKHQKFFEDLAEREVFSKLNPKKKTILYAPTWNDYEDSTSIFNTYQTIFEKIPEKFNLILKLHPSLEYHLPGRVHHILGKYENYKDTIILLNFPIIYPLLSKTDIYLGDFSSIGYDFLTFNRPMFFFNSTKKGKEDKSRFLHQCGVEVSFQECEKISEIISKNLDNEKKFKAIRQKIYLYTFGEKISHKEIQKNLEKIFIET